MSASKLPTPEALDATRKVRRFSIPAAALPDIIARPPAPPVDASRSYRRLLAMNLVAIGVLVAIIVLITEPWEPLRLWLMRP